MNNAEQISQNLENLSIVELRELQDKAGDLIKDKIEAEAQENIENIITVIKKNQIPLLKLLRAIRINNAIYHDKNKDGSLRKIYYNKQNPLEFFDGIGRKPKWFKDLEDSGADLNEHVVSLDNL
jgi:DNA-binding protein H-NS